MAVSEEEFYEVALSFPNTLRKTSYGNPSVFAGRKFFTRLRSEDNSIVWFVTSLDERDTLLELDPEIYHITDHYKNYKAVLVRLSQVDKTTLHKMLEQCWRRIALKRDIKTYDEAKK